MSQDDALHPQPHVPPHPHPNLSASLQPPAAPGAGFDHDLERGLRNRRAVLGDAWVDRSINNATRFSADFQNFMTRYAWHEVWGRPGLDLRTRRIIVLAITAALGRWEEFELHTRAALAGGEPATRLTLEEVRETLIQTAIYAGVPAANTAHALTARILRELAAEPGSPYADALAPLPAQLASHPGVGRPLYTPRGHDAGGRPLPAIHYTVREPRLTTAVPGAAFAPGAEAPTTVVLAHALGLDAMMWDALANQLALDHRVVCYDQRGHGASDCPPGPYSIADLAADAARVIEHAGGSATAPVVFIGLSLGGMVGQQLALSRPELLRGLVLANTSAAYPASARAVWNERMAAVQAGGLEAVADGALQRWFHEGFRAVHAAKVARWRRRIVSQNPEGYLACCAAIRELDLAEQIRHIRLPSLVIAGELDMSTPPAMGEAIAQQIAGAQYVLIKRASHLSVLEQPLAFSNLVREFLASL
ncbi:MAG: 3-oxoadipate enol-lactonase [Pseudomonadota bacterium]|jgi:3-oxoadipate enol-lactonase